MIGNTPGLFSIVQGVRAEAARGQMPAVVGRAMGGPVDMNPQDAAAADAMQGYASMAAGPSAAPAPSGPMMPTGASLVPQGATDPNLQLYIAVAMQYGLVTPDGQPDIQKAQQMLAQNPGLADQLAQPAQSATSNIPGVPGRMDGGPVHVAGYSPYGTGIDPNDYGPPLGGGAPGGAPGTGAPPDLGLDAWKYQTIAENHKLVTTDPTTGEQSWDVDQAKKLYDSNPAHYNDELSRTSSGGGSDAATYASIAERANEAAQQLAFDREREAHQMAMARQQVASDAAKAATDFSLNQEALKSARKQLHNDAVTSALSAWSANVGKANIPGIQNWRMAGGQASDDIMSGMPLLNFNPLEAYGKQLSEPAQLTAPNIPGIDFGAA